MRLRGQEIATEPGCNHLANCLPAKDRPALIRQWLGIKIRFVSCRLWQTDAAWVIEDRHVPDDFFTLPVHGDLCVRVGNRSWNLQPGQIAVIPAGVTHAMQYQSGSESLVLSLHLLLRTNDGRPVLASADAGVLTLPNATHWIDDLTACAALLDDDVGAGHLMGDALGRLLAAELVRLGLACHPPQQITDSRIAQALSTMQNLDTNTLLRIADLAQTAGLGLSRFRALFQSQVGLAPKVYLDNQRLMKAEDLLFNSKHPIKTIAQLAGFPCLRHFLARFKARHGVSPQTWRNQQHRGF